jgi:hypothetical protein
VRQGPGERCGACCDGKHGECVVTVPMNVLKTRGRPHKGEDIRSRGKPSPYVWVCRCRECELCVSCQRVKVEVRWLLFRCEACRAEVAV